MGAKLREDVRDAAVELLDAVRDIPAWNGAPAPEVRAWWHRRRATGGCDVPGCNRFPCYCYPDEEQAMDWRLRDVEPMQERAQRIYTRFRIELDEIDPRIGELLSDPWVPDRDNLVRLLVEVVRGRGDVLGLDPKTRAILAALAQPAESLAEVAARTRGPIVSLSTTKKLSAALQEQGLVRKEPDGTWTRTDEGARVLGT